MERPTLRNLEQDATCAIKKKNPAISHVQYQREELKRAPWKFAPDEGGWWWWGEAGRGEGGRRAEVCRRFY